MMWYPDELRMIPVYWLTWSASTASSWVTLGAAITVPRILSFSSAAASSVKVTAMIRSAPSPLRIAAS